MSDDALHDEIRIDLAAYALGALDAETCERLERHLDECSECRAALQSYQDVTGLLPFALPMQAPPPGARAVLLARARVATPEPGLTDFVRDLVPRTRARFMALAAALLIGILAASGTGYLISERNDTAGGPGIGWSGTIDGYLVPMSGSDAAPSAVGQLIVYRGDDRTILLVSDLPPLPPGQEYEFWFVYPDQRHVKCAMFTVDENGQSIVRVRIPGHIEQFVGIGVTVEPAGGSSEPTGQVMMTGRLPAND
jgi:anti-sigma-K factor RskA